MAKKRERISAGLSIQDILNIPMSKFEKYTPTQQRELVSRLASAANKRYSKFEQKGIVNPAILKMQMEGGRISVRNKTPDEIKEEYFRAKKFLKSGLSTQKGYKQYTKRLKEAINRETKTGIQKGMPHSEVYASSFAYYDLLQETDAKIANIADKYKIVEQIAEYIEDGQDEQQVFENINKYLAQEYEREQEEFNNLSVSFGEQIEDDTPKRYRRIKRKRKGL